MTEPLIPAKQPFPEEVEKDKTYYWCACGRSATQPFCDGSHKDTDIRPIPWTAPKNKIVFFCGCKQSATAPICDGTHSRLAGDA